MRIIINADDLGYSLDTNNAIFSLMAHHRITSATLMGNGAAFQDAVKRIPDFVEMSFGAHLTITELPSLTQPDIFFETKLIDDNGVFTSTIHGIRRSPALKHAILKEWEQQVVKIMDHGVPVSHFDSHHHVHTIPWLFTTLKRLQRRFGIRRVRTTLNRYYRNEHTPSRRLLFQKKVWHLALRSWYRTNTTDYFTFVAWFLANLRNGEVDSRKTMELMCHPGHQSNAEETDSLRSDWLREAPFGTELISYNQL